MNSILMQEEVTAPAPSRLPGILRWNQTMETGNLTQLPLLTLGGGLNSSKHTINPLRRATDFMKSHKGIAYCFSHCVCRTCVYRDINEMKYLARPTAKLKSSLKASLRPIETP